MADSGVDISGNDPDPSVAKAFAGRLGESAVAYTDDMGIQAAAVQAVEKAVETFGGIDIVVNNAAILRDAFVFKGNADDWDAVIRNNLSGRIISTPPPKLCRIRPVRAVAAARIHMGPPGAYRVTAVLWETTDRRYAAARAD